MKRYSFICETEGERIDKTLTFLFPEQSRSFLQGLIAEGRVTVNGKTVSKSCKPSVGDTIEVEIPDPVAPVAVPEDIPLEIAWEDEHLLVVNKPKGMVVHPAAGNYTGTLVNALLHYCGDSLSGINGVLRPGIVHRIDKDTSGLLIVAKTDPAHRGLAEQIKEHSFTRQYEAIVVGHMRQPEGRVDAPIARSSADRKKMAIVAGGKPAVTNYETLAEYAGYSHLRLTLETGRTHQIRVHMAHIGHPVVCDTVYGLPKGQFACCEGQCLHARRIAFEHPITGEHIDLTAPLPEYFGEILRRMQG
ncbi:MAG: RluA family pseudouridine synthase [Ruminococcaceae bacterium]|nr:RluA family pseudouridine synthase [Oscillospiraceae bacterium]